MKCPRDGTDLISTIRNGIEIDHCPACSGVWLDRGELDKLITQAAPVMLAEPPRAQPEPAPTPMQADHWPTSPSPSSEPWHDHFYRDEGYKDRRSSKKKKHKKRGGFADFLEDIFDFD